MLCPSCRRQLNKGAAYCLNCGAPLGGADEPFELVLADETRVPVVNEVTIGRAPGNTLQVADPSVSRLHARIHAKRGNDGPTIEDAGSSHGTFVDGQRLAGSIALRDGAKIKLGDAEMTVQRRRSEMEAGRTIVVQAGASLVLSAAGKSDLNSQATQFGCKPKLRSGYALKRLDESEGTQRWVLKDLKTDKFRRMDDTDAALFELLDGTHSLVDLIGLAEQKVGAGGSARLARLLADLGERGFLAGVASDNDPLPEGMAPPEGKIRKLFKQRTYAFEGLSNFFDKLYSRGGWLIFTRPVLILLALIMAAGFARFVGLILGRYGTPFVVAKKVGIGGLIFLLGRFAFVAVHETAHGLTMASYGRKVGRAGLKLMFIIPYAFVDTSEAWFETRKRRIAISAAGPVSDLSIGGLFSIICLVSPKGTTRDIFFNLAFAAYVGGIFNLNPFLDRDGYHIMVDVLGEPNLRKRAREQFARRLSGKKTTDDSQVLARYGVASVGWLFVMGGGAIFMSLRYAPIMEHYTSKTVVHGVLGTLWVVVFTPVLFTVGKPLWEKRKKRKEEEAAAAAAAADQHEPELEPAS